MPFDTHDNTIPVINMQDFFDPALHDKFVAELADALHTMGFVAVINPGIDIKTLDTAYDVAANFFGKELSYKIQVNDPKLSGFRGYVLSEVAKDHNVKDYKEFYHIGRNDNLWPEQMPEFSESMSNLYQVLEKLTIPFQQAISEALGQHKDFIPDMTTDSHSLLRALHYPANVPQDTVWAAPHTDIDLFTVLPRATGPGLQLKNAAGDWIDVVVPEDAFIINAGDMLQNLSNGVFKSSMHRVVNLDTTKERYSMVFFVHPGSEVDVSPLPSHVQKVGKALYPQAREKDLLAERLTDLGLASPTMMLELYRSGLVGRMQQLGTASPKVIAALKCL
jgi:isopenicillin N synthase-like dioxygenase